MNIDGPMEAVGPDRLAAMATCITTFMGEKTSNSKTYGELVAIFGRDVDEATPDPSNDRRVLLYEEAMVQGTWRGPIRVTMKDGFVVDGIHRGIAYLRVVANGADPDKLPRVDLVME